MSATRRTRRGRQGQSSQSFVRRVPFSATSQPIADACTRNGFHYLDSIGEPDVFEPLASATPFHSLAIVMLLASRSLWR
jgi:hypothetical protein